MQSGKIGNSLDSGQYRAKCVSPLQFTSRSCQSSKQSLQCLVPSSVSVLRWVPSTSVKVVHTGPVLDRAILFDSEAGDQSRSSTARTDIGTGASESFYSSNVKSSQTKSQPTWDERRSQNAETARQWSLYLNRQQRGFGHHLSGLKLFSSVTPNPTLCTRCKYLVPVISASLIYSEDNVGLILPMLSFLKFHLTAFMLVWYYAIYSGGLTLIANYSWL